METEIKQAVILAGGKGERLRPYTDTMPKPMYPIHGIPFIVRLILQIKSFGIKRIVVLLGYLAEKIIAELGDGSRLGVQIIYDTTPAEYDTGERLVHAEGLLDNRFLLMYCDNFCPVNFERLVSESFSNDADIQISVYSNKDKYTKDNLSFDKKSGKVTKYDKSRKTKELAGVDIGYAVVKRQVIKELPEKGGSFSAVYSLLAEKGTLYATVTDHRYYSIGSYERMELTKDFFSGKRAAFIDRDGTLNVRPPKACYVEKPSDFVWISGAKEAVKLLKQAGIITILVSNQPGIARGNMTEEDLAAIHQRMEAELEEIGASIDYIYYCPHGWDEGCDCRKPKPGMLYRAQRDLSLNLTECVLFGDDERDIQAGNAAGCRTIMVDNQCCLLQAVRGYLKDEKVRGRI